MFDAVPFLQDILSSIVAAILVIVSSSLFTFKFRKQFLAFLGRLVGSGLECVYANDEEASKDIVRSVRRSDRIRVLSMRAFRLLKDSAPLAFLLREDCPIQKVRILLANPDSQSVAARAEEFIHIDTSYTQERYIEDIRWSAKQVALNQRNKNLQLRMHDEPAFVRLLITDDYLFLSFFLRDVHGDSSRVFRINRISPLYEAFCRYHDWVWNHRSQELTKAPQNRDDRALS